MKIYTKTGDSGETGLYDGTRVFKNEQIFDVLGSLDELSAHIGMLIFHTHKTSISFLRNIQQNLLYIGSIIATPNPKEGQKLPVISDEHTLDIEKYIDELTLSLKPLNQFILQGGNSMSESQAHICRTVTRRTERELLKYGNVNEHIIKYMNRLSDLFFTIARYESI